MITVFWVVVLCSMVSISEEYIKSHSLPLKMEAARICKEKFFTYEIGRGMLL
jgi:hypothetical protein